MVMVNKDRGWETWLVGNLGLLVKDLFPPVSALQTPGVRGVGHDNAAGDMPRVERLKSRLRIHVGSLVPQLNSQLLAIDL